MREYKFRIWMSNEESPKGKMYYGNDEAPGRRVIMISMLGDLFSRPSELGK